MEGSPPREQGSMIKKYTIDNHEHAYITNPDGKVECNYCGILASTFEPVTPTQNIKGEIKEAIELLYDSQLEFFEKYPFVDDFIDLFSSELTQEREKIREKVEALMPLETAKKIVKNNKMFRGEEDCSLCGYNPIRQREMILKLLDSI